MGTPRDPILYIVSVCDGIGGGLVAASKYTEIKGRVCEKNDDLRKFVEEKWPGVTSTKTIEELKAADMAEEMKAIGATVVLLIGGPPCQPFSGLGTKPKGFDEERSAPIREFVRVKKELALQCQVMGIRFLWLMEEVASMSVTHREEINARLEAQPVLLNAADFGIIHRARLYWGLDLATLQSTSSRLREMKPVEVFPPGKVAEGLSVVRWTGKSEPEGWTPEDGYEWRHREEHGTTACMPPGTKYAPSYPTGRLSALTTIFPHPADRPPRGRNDPDVYQRFIDDKRRRPLFQYARGNMVWKGEAARSLSPEEAEDVMGFPKGYTKNLRTGNGQTVHDARLSAIGNSFHIPSVVLLLALLFNPLAPADAAALIPAMNVESLTKTEKDEWEKKYTAGTEYSGDGRGMVTDGAGIAWAAVAMFKPTMLAGMEAEVQKMTEDLRKLPLGGICNFEGFLRRTGAPKTATGPDIQALWSKSPMHAAVAKQHRPSVAQGSQDRIFPLIDHVQGGGYVLYRGIFDVRNIVKGPPNIKAKGGGSTPEGTRGRPGSPRGLPADPGGGANSLPVGDRVQKLVRWGGPMVAPACSSAAFGS